MITTKTTPINRRGVLLAAMGLPLGVTLTACATGGTEEPIDGPQDEDREIDPDNPFDLNPGSSVEAVIFDGGYDIDYVEFAAEVMNGNFPEVTITVDPTIQISSEMQPRFVGGEPPDLIDNSGAYSMGFITILHQLEELEDVIDAPNLEGTTIRDTLYEGVLAPGLFDDRLLAINYVLTLYGLWYSGSLFAEHGWDPPTTWADAKELGAAAQREDLYLFCWGQEAATYYQTLAIDSAIKEAGHEVRLALENLEEGCWSHPALQDVFAEIKAIVDAGYIMPGGSGTQFTAAQTQWSLDQQVLLYPSGSWIENEMREQTAEGFEMHGVPTLSLTGSAALPATALHSTAEVPLIIGSDAANVAGGKELIRTMLSEEAAVNFAREKLAPTVVAGTVPDDGFGSTALVSQIRMVEEADSEVFTWDFVNRYGMNQEQLVVWNSFLDGQSSLEDLTGALQAITDGVREDEAIEKVEVT